MTIDIPRLEALGAEFFRWQIATATAGWLLEINPFDEPNVQEAKDATRALLQTYTTHRELPLDPPHVTTDACQITFSQAAQTLLGGRRANAFLDLFASHDYFALLAYVAPDDSAIAPMLQRIRSHVAVTTACATTFGYGPRYLHSTGQLHKGGANNGVFLIVTAHPEIDVDIPDAPYSFAVLEMAQALGDFRSLDRAGRRAVHVHLSSRDVTSLKSAATLLGISLGKG